MNDYKRDLASAYMQARTAEQRGLAPRASALLKRLLILSLTDQQHAIYHAVCKQPGLTAGVLQKAHPHKNVPQVLAWLISTGLVAEEQAAFARFGPVTRTYTAIE